MGSCACGIVKVNNLGMFGDKNQGFEKEVFFEDFV